MSEDRIEKQIRIQAPRSRVWRALTDAESFGQWFGVTLQGAFAPRATLKSRIEHKGYEHVTLEMTIEQMQPEHFFSWRWHPHAIDPNFDYSAEPKTLVTFELEEAPDGTLLKVTESGFNGIPLGRRGDAYRGNEKGWEIQVGAIQRYVTEATQPR